MSHLHGALPILLSAATAIFWTWPPTKASPLSPFSSSRSGWRNNKRPDVPILEGNTPSGSGEERPPTVHPHPCGKPCLLDGLQVAVDGPGVTVLGLNKLRDCFPVRRVDEAPDDAPLASELIATSHWVPFAGVKPRRENASKRHAILGKAVNFTRIKRPRSPRRVKDSEKKRG